MTEADAVVVGAGHNGLVAAAYLAMAGRSVHVYEGRTVAGGACVTEDLVPGFRVSTAAYSLSLFRPDVFGDLALARRGVVIRPKDPQLFVPLPDGRCFFVWRDAARTRDELARIHPPDADAYVRWSAFWDEAVALLRPLAEDPDPPDLAGVERELAGRGRADVWKLAVAGSVAETVSSFFASDEIRGAFATQGLIGTFAGVHDPGTAWVMAYHGLGGELAGATGTWATVRGGMGAVTRALAEAATSHGAEIRTGVPVGEIVVGEGRARGVRLADGTTVPARTVLSNADPKRTFLTLVPGGALDGAFIDRVREWPTPGSVIKVNAALEELPDFISHPGTAPGPQHSGTIEIAPSLEYLAQAFGDAVDGRTSAHPFMEVFIGSAVDPTLAPPGKHVLSAFAQYAPAEPGEAWEGQREEAGNAVLSTLASLAPNVADAVIASEVLGPPELEARFGLTGGNIFHGEILPERCFGDRFDYRSPIRGLYLCGSGARPGGGVMGAAGRNAARAVLADLSS